ncbi:MAG TPA: sulfatase-like hydrolase/transferase [Chitinophagaceae bacterium]|nr:sulfatase-like hydrolase/transferase [Chitinophagaceae bacterium]
MQRIKSFLERWGIHCFLLPVFFALHNYIQYYGLVSPAVTLHIFIKIFFLVVIFFLLLLAIIRNVNKSMQLTTLAGFIILFFGVMKDFLNDTLKIHFLARYTILLPTLTLLTIILVILILKKKNFKKNNLFQNILLLVFIFADSLTLLTSASNYFLKKNLLVEPDTLIFSRLTAPAGRPDVYYLLFDCYPGTDFLQDYMQFDNSFLNSTLEKKGFYVVKNPKSNYNRTAFSLSSTLNFQYLNKIRNNTAATSKDYSQARLTIEYAEVPEIFKYLNYKMYNLSIFDFPGEPAIYRESFLTLPESDVLMYNTLPERIKNDILWNFVSVKNKDGSVKKRSQKAEDEFVADESKKRDFNNKVVDSLLKVPAAKSGGPKFVYAHFYLPHPPFFYDKDGKANDLKHVVTAESFKNKDLFLSYLEYTNKIILRIADTLLSQPCKTPIIIIQSDHGFQDFDGGPTTPYLYFKNYSAFYFPDKNYSTLYDTLSNVNTFPLLLNKYFEANISLQKDTSVFLPD